MTELFLTIVIILLVILILLHFRGRKLPPSDLESAISSTWIKLGLGEKLGVVERHAAEIKASYKSFEQLIRAPKERSYFGEISLETILSDQLPPEMFGIRQRVLDGKIPDAHIKSSDGIICIDSKFPLDNFARFSESSDPDEKKSFQRDFFRDVAGHLTKIEQDYICPQHGSASFAFAYIPSEAVFYFLLTESYEMLRKYAKLGVQVVSPLTFSQKIELIRAGVHAKKLSESADRVKEQLVVLSRRFEELDKVWQVFYRTHFKNLESKAEELDRSYRSLKEEFERVERLGEPDRT